MKVNTLYRIDIRSSENIISSTYYGQQIDDTIITPTHHFDLDSSTGKYFELEMNSLTNHESIIDRNGIVHVKLKKRITPYTLIEVITPIGQVLREIKYAPRFNVDFKLLYTIRKDKVRLRYLIYFGKKASKQTYLQDNYQPFQLKGLLRPDTNEIISRIVEAEMEIDSFISRFLHHSMYKAISHVKKTGKKFNAEKYVKNNYEPLILRVKKGEFSGNKDFENFVQTTYSKTKFKITPKVYKRNGKFNPAGLADALAIILYSEKGEKRGVSALTKIINNILEKEGF